MTMGACTSTPLKPSHPIVDTTEPRQRTPSLLQTTHTPLVKRPPPPAPPTATTTPTSTAPSTPSYSSSSPPLSSSFSSSSSSSSSSTLSIDTQLSLAHFEPVHVIGVGGFGVVHSVRPSATAQLLSAPLAIASTKNCVVPVSSSSTSSTSPFMMMHEDEVAMFSAAVAARSLSTTSTACSSSSSSATSSPMSPCGVHMLATPSPLPSSSSSSHTSPFSFTHTTPSPSNQQQHKPLPQLVQTQIHTPHGLPPHHPPSQHFHHLTQHDDDDDDFSSSSPAAAAFHVTPLSTSPLTTPHASSSSHSHPHLSHLPPHHPIPHPPPTPPPPPPLLYCLKRMPKYNVLRSQFHLDSAWNERDIGVDNAKFDEPFLTPLLHALQTPTELVLITPLLKGGNLYHRVKQRGRLPEIEAKFYCAEIMLGLQSLHRRNIVYRDLKPSNVLLDEHGHIRICDFGLACFLLPQYHYQVCSKVGTDGYNAPEMSASANQSTLTQRYGCEVDYYSLGIVLYELMHGHHLRPTDYEQRRILRAQQQYTLQQLHQQYQQLQLQLQQLTTTSTLNTSHASPLSPSPSFSSASSQSNADLVDELVSSSSPSSSPSFSSSCTSSSSAAVSVAIEKLSSTLVLLHQQIQTLSSRYKSQPADDVVARHELATRHSCYFASHISAAARSLIVALLTADPKERIGARLVVKPQRDSADEVDDESEEEDAEAAGRRLSQGWEEVKQHPFFADIDWARLAHRAVTPPYVPPSSLTLSTSALQDEVSAMASVEQYSARPVSQSAHQLQFAGWEHNVNVPLTPTFTATQTTTITPAAAAAGTTAASCSTPSHVGFGVSSRATSSMISPALRLATATATATAAPSSSSFCVASPPIATPPSSPMTVTSPSSVNVSLFN